ncbi:Helix-turn-helix [Herbiconiux ginsengi]|uniref:Helix-turn-helix n=2 Tax=Herbiconiux ginsengi TaxID=381665 RepID=A0A1H3PNE5_9MICO|nr:Helix-turn-helix [Herbiconiux ginsengi]
MTQDQLSAELDQIGRPIPKASIGRIESGDRRVDIDDLMALAYALNVSPLSLLLPFPNTPYVAVSLLENGTEIPAEDAWLWGLGVSPHFMRNKNHDEAARAAERQQFQEMSKPWWLDVQADFSADLRASRQIRDR